MVHQPARGLVKMKWLDLRGVGISVLERLLLEEFLWRFDSTRSNWLIVGHHEPAQHRYLTHPQEQQKQYNSNNTMYHNAAAIVLGIGGKPPQLLNLDKVREDQVLTIKRFSGGGTVVLDPDSIWTTIIGASSSPSAATGSNNIDAAHSNNNDHDQLDHSNTIPVERYPRSIMKWSMGIFGPMVDRLGEIQQQLSLEQQRQKNLNHSHSSGISKEFLPGSGRKLTMVLDTKSCGAFENTGRMFTIPDKKKNSQPAASTSTSILTKDATSTDADTTMMASRLTLQENDYVLGGERKVAGNAQSIGKSGWLHHTCWLWDYQAENMQYLQLPTKRPEYRKDRSHDDFLTTMRSHFPLVKKSQFYTCLKQVVESQFHVETITLPTVMDMVVQQSHQGHGGGSGNAMEKLLETSRTKVLTDLSFDKRR